MSRGSLSVVMLSASFHPYVGGAEKQALELSAALRARGAEVRVLTRRVPGLPRKDEARGVPILRLWCLGSGFTNAATFMLSSFAWLLVMADSYDAIHVHLAGSPALAAALAGWLLQKPVVVKLGGGRGIGELAASAKTAGGRLKLRLLAALRPRFVAVAKDLADEAAQYLGPVPLEVLPNGVDVERYRPAAAPEKTAMRARLGWPEGLAFLYVGRLSWEKKLPWFVETWGAVLKESPSQAFCAFVGEGPEADAIREAARRAGVSDKVLVLPPMEAIWTAYAASDVFVLPSVSEGLSNALLEAMASGLAVLASRVGGTPEAVEDGRTGYLFVASDAEDLKKALHRLLEQPGLALAMGRAARAAAEERYAMERVVGRLEALYRGEE